MGVRRFDNRITTGVRFPPETTATPVPPSYAVAPATVAHQTSGRYAVPGTQLVQWGKYFDPVNHDTWGINIKLAQVITYRKVAKPRTESIPRRIRGASVTTPRENARFDDGDPYGDVYR